MTPRLALFALLSLPVAALAGETTKAPNSTPKADGTKDPTSAVQDLAFAARLAAWGQANANPEALLTAAHMLAAINSEEHAANKTTKPIEGITQKDKDEAEAPTLDPAKLAKLALAYAVAHGDKNEIKYVDGAVKAGVHDDKGTGSAKYGITKAAGGYIDVYNIQFTGGELAEIAVTGDGDTDLDLYVYDEFGNFVGSDTGVTDSGYLSWTPRWTGNFRVEVRNEGQVYNQYLLITN